MKLKVLLLTLFSKSPVAFADEKAGSPLDKNIDFVRKHMVLKGV